MKKRDVKRWFLLSGVMQVIAAGFFGAAFCFSGRYLQAAAGGIFLLSSGFMFYAYADSRRYEKLKEQMEEQTREP